MYRTAFALALALALGGCAAEEAQAPDPVPAALRDIESTAEGAFDKALAGDAAGVSTDATALDSQWKAFRPQALKDGAAEADAVALDTALANLGTTLSGASQGTELARAANQVSAPMDSLFAVYGPPVPTELMTLDYLGRELLLDARDTDFPRAGSDLGTTQATWTALRDRVVKAGGTTEAGQFDSVLVQLKTASDASDGTALEARAVDELDLVDAIEAVFQKQVAADAPD